MSPEIQAHIKEKMRAILATSAESPDDDVSEFIRGAMQRKLDDWDHSSLRSGLTREERDVLVEHFQGQEETWVESLYVSDRQVFNFLRYPPCDECVSLTDAEIIELYPEEAKELGLLDSTAGLKVGMFGTLKMKRGENRLVCISEITARGKVKAEKFDETTGEWSSPGYIDPGDLLSTWEEEEDENE